MNVHDLYLQDDPNSVELDRFEQWVERHRIPRKIYGCFGWVVVHVVARSSAELELAYHNASHRDFRRKAIREDFVPDEKTETHNTWEKLLIGPFIAYLWLLNAKDAVFRRRKQ